MRYRGFIKRLICKLGCRFSCGLRPCLRIILLSSTCRITFLCLYHNTTNYRKIDAYVKQEAKWLGLKSKNTCSFILLKSLSPLPCNLTNNNNFTASWIVSFFMTLPPFDSFVQSKNPIWVPWLIKGFFP